MNSIYSRRIVPLPPWISTIPKNWNLLRSKFLFEAVDIRSDDGSEELLTVSSAYGVIPRKYANVTMFEAVSYEGYKLCWPGDLVINSLWAWAYALGISQYHGIVSAAYGVYRVIPKVKADLRYLHWLLRSVPFQWELQTRSKGIWISRLQLTDEAFLSAPILFPTYKEQQTISKYLDHTDQMLRGGVSQKLELVELMEEYKRAVIQQAVTRGLDPDVPLKPSGVEWLGDIPVHWELLRLKTVMNERSEKGYPNEPLLSSTQKSGVILQENYENRTVLAMKDLHLLKLVLVGDFVISLRSFQGGIEFARDRGIISPAYTIIYPSNPRYHGYFAWLFKSKGFIENLKLHVTGIREGQNIDYERLSRSLIPIPPVEEQTAIVAHLDKLTSDIDTAIAHTRHEIELLEEYRTRLIADVVTGKLDVREAAANLPDVNLDNIQPLAEGGEAGD